MTNEKRYGGGRVFSADEAPQQPADKRLVRPRFPCFADGCPMAGSIFPAGSSSGVCPWHYGANASDIPRITRTLDDWRCVAREIDKARQVLTDPRGVGPRELDAALAAGWARLQPVVAPGGWERDLAPAKGQRLDSWARMLERFMRERVQATLAPQERAA